MQTIPSHLLTWPGLPHLLSWPGPPHLLTWPGLLFLPYQSVCFLFFLIGLACLHLHAIALSPWLIITGLILQPAVRIGACGPFRHRQGVMILLVDLHTDIVVGHLGHPYIPTPIVPLRFSFQLEGFVPVLLYIAVCLVIAC